MFKRGLVFDLARCSGWALSREGAQPRSGSFSIIDGKETIGDNRGRIYARLYRKIDDLVQAYRPHYLGWEAPNRFKKRSMITERFLVGLCNVCELYAGQHELGAYEENVNTVRADVVGDASLGKEGAMAWCRERRFTFADDNESDALVLLEYIDSAVNERALLPKLGTFF